MAQDFLSLPLELRNKIYDFLLEDCTIVLQSDTRRLWGLPLRAYAGYLQGPPPTCRRQSLGLLRSCWQIHHELLQYLAPAIPVLITSNHSNAWIKATTQYGRLTAKHLSLLKHITIDCGHLGSRGPWLEVCQGIVGSELPGLQSITIEGDVYLPQEIQDSFGADRLRDDFESLDQFLSTAEMQESMAAFVQEKWHALSQAIFCSKDSRRLPTITFKIHFGRFIAEYLRRGERTETGRKVYRRQSQLCPIMTATILSTKSVDSVVSLDKTEPWKEAHRKYRKERDSVRWSWVDGWTVRPDN